ncbi:hypothetical protein RM531_06035 [Salinisphaera sp. P385]|uniref:Cytochrome c domain-containing protein n=1 Tax=Spectribacter acetivorans TaxID=3075603 RepID=A0ABU3B6G6_9GAMM|nr:hypothetical protein [Salinisphaera sp. P385]MDT0618025.1 hypothetical protein [Salinisphaera sp. P385]
MPFRQFLLAAVIATVALPAVAADINARRLITDDCTGCHGNEVFSRQDRTVSSMPGLKARVRNCTAVAGADWSSNEMQAVVEYLNERYYDF